MYEQCNLGKMFPTLVYLHSLENFTLSTISGKLKLNATLKLVSIMYIMF